MALDLNDAGPQRIGGTIPDGSYVHVIMTLRPGGADGAESVDKGLLLQSPKSDALMLDCEFTVIDGSHAKQKFWQKMTVSGGKVDGKGKSMAWSITKRTIGAMIESATGIHPNDSSPAAKSKRCMRGFSDLEGIEFWCKTGIESSEPYADKTSLDYVITPDMAEYADLKAGKEVTPKPSGARKAKPAAEAGQAAWGGNQAPATQSAPSWGGAPKTSAQPAAPEATTAARPSWANRT